MQEEFPVYTYRLKPNSKKHYMRGNGHKVKAIEPGEEVTVLDPSELGGAISKFELVNGEEIEEAEKVLDQPTNMLEKHETDDGFIVLNADGVNILDDGVFLDEEDADAIVETGYIPQQPQEEVETGAATKPEFELKDCGSGWFQIVNSAGEEQLDKKMRRAEAKAKLDELNG